METIRVKYLRGVKPIERFNVGDWIDLRCAEDTCLNTGEFALIPLGVAVQLPAGYEAVVAPRSSTFIKYGLIMTNGLGIIDESYCGDGDEWHFPAYALRKTRIMKNERICQFRIIEHQPLIQLNVVDSLGNTNRGGFGSTGKE